MPPEADFARAGWCRLPASPALDAWLADVRAVALALAAAQGKAALRAGGTWLAGVGLLPNDGEGRVGGGPALPLLPEVAAITGFAAALDRGQVSVCHPGYPRRDPGESAASFRFRRDRDAAHLDGLLPEGPDRRRHLREHHAFILGLPLTETGPGAAPTVVWDGSHRLMRRAFAAAFAGLPAKAWGDADVTEVYAAARARAFAECPRVALRPRMGEAVLLHRHLLHGIAPWEDGAAAPAEGRAVLWFRPDPFPGAAPDWWLERP